MNKNDLSRAVHDVHGGISHVDALKIVDFIFGCIKDRLIRGEKVVLSGFGSFRVSTRKDRRGVNPQTGKSMIIQGRKGIIFKPSKYLKNL